VLSAVEVTSSAFAIDPLLERVAVFLSPAFEDAGAEIAQDADQVHPAK
jgi:hypothetical protein